MLLNMASKLFCRVILERIKIVLDAKLRVEQAGFRAGSIEWQSSLYINFIDFEQAFYTIGREVLWRLLRHDGMPVKAVAIIRAFL